MIVVHSGREPLDSYIIIEVSSLQHEFPFFSQDQVGENNRRAEVGSSGYTMINTFRVVDS